MRSPPKRNLKLRAPLWIAASALCLLSGCVGIEQQRLVSKPNMQFSRNAAFSYSSKLMPQIQPGLATAGGAQPSTCTVCR